ncbi:hypothetical protein [Dyadobacter aurulentus]|uniref:hypothetical protein n=1 Tax=Dyadobacter sp. UC 10 TaxID=2605428 RepID=UPI0011F0B1E2|nr:hypothetical protein [Dyadobacter sp. UC 10]KAA0992055.1 hypothetical protein FXO21_18685 [Dyadobacter sp. UC 10]
MIHTQGNSALNGAAVLLYYGSVVSSPALSAVTQPTCTTTTGSFTITNYNSALSYTITPAGATRNGAVVTAPAGSGPYSLTASNGTCSSGTVQSGTVNTQPSTSAPVISASNPTCAEPTGSIVVNYPIGGATYTLSPGNITSTTGSFSGLPAGSGPYAVTSTIDGCTSNASNAVSIGAAATGCAGPPDLRPLVSMGDVGFIKPSALSRSATLKLYNVGDPNSSASGAITIYIYPPNNNFSIALDASPGWNLAYDAGGNYYTLASSTTTIAYGTSSFEAINLTINAAPEVSKGKYNIQFEVGDTSGGETNNLNNTVSVEVTVSNM